MNEGKLNQNLSPRDAYAAELEELTDQELFQLRCRSVLAREGHFMARRRRQHSELTAKVELIDTETRRRKDHGEG